MKIYVMIAYAAGGWLSTYVQPVWPMITALIVIGVAEAWAHADAQGRS